ncbi:MAG: DUF3048 domain-containing protein [Candidatus Saccharibacteria bacterium]
MIDDFRPKEKARAAKRNAAKIPPPAGPVTPVEAPNDDPVIEIVPETKTPKMAETPKMLPAKTKRRPHIWPDAWSRKKKRLFTGLLVLLALGLIGGGAYWYRAKHQTKAAVVTKTTVAVAPKPTTVPSSLTGLPVAPEVNQRVVTGVMIENSPDARPQSGLFEAGVVYEAVAEGGITRFLALFQDTQPAYVGPIRSSRPYYLDWLLPFNASYAHVGGSPEALQQIKALGVRDMDQFANSSAYDRITSRYAPHNVYTSIARLVKLAESKGYTTSTYTGFARKPKESPAATPTAKTIDLTISGPLYNPHYDYDTTTNSYKRSEGGKPHTDEKSGTQLSPKVVIALVIPSAIEADGSHNSYATTGTGSMYVFQDGTVTPGTWKKDSRSSQFIFTDSAGQPLLLNPGQTWLSIVNTTGSVVYIP